MYATTTDLLDALEDATDERLDTAYLHRWRAVGFVRPLERNRRRDHGFAWPDWTLPMARLIRLEVRNTPIGAHQGRTIIDVLLDVARALELEPEAAYVTITPDGNVAAHTDGTGVYATIAGQTSAVIVAIPTTN